MSATTRTLTSECCCFYIWLCFFPINQQNTPKNVWFKYA